MTNIEHRPLGKTGLSLSVVGFGTSPLGDEFGRIDAAEGERAVHAAIDQGINYFDVSPYYGRTLAETRLGQALEGKRHAIILATKAGRYDVDLDSGFDFSAQRIFASVEESLKRLQTDYIDVYQVHDIEFGSKQQIIEETLPAMFKLREQGKVRFIGITGYPLHLLKAVAGSTEVDMVMTYCHYDLLNTMAAKVLMPMTRERGIGLINASPLHMGVLTERGAPHWHPAPEEVLAAGRQAAAWCRQQGGNIAELALPFAFSYVHVATTLVGMSKVEHVRRNIQMAEVKPDPELLRGVLEIIKPVADIHWIVGRPENNDPGSVPSSNTAKDMI